jgi:nucleotide-binding universal stress UspA family protein
MYQHILVPLDGSKLAECAVPWAQELAKRVGVEKVSLVTVIRESKGYRRTTDYSKTPTSPPVTEPAGKKEREAEKYLAVMAKNLQDVGIKVETKILLGDPAQAILFHAEHDTCDLIVMAAHGRSGLGRLLKGSVSGKVFRGTCKPILMVRGPGCVPGV